MAIRVRYFDGISALLLGLILMISSKAYAHPADASEIQIIYHENEIELGIKLPDYELKMALPEFEKWNEIPKDILLDYLNPHFELVSKTKQPVDLQITSTEYITEGNQSQDHFYNFRFKANLTPTDWPITLVYDGITHKVINHKTYIWLVQDLDQGIFSDNPLLLDVIHNQHTSVQLDKKNTDLLQGLFHLFKMGMHHIVEGLDHLIFLLGLIWICASRARYQNNQRLWQQALWLISSFSLGHSLSLALASLNLVSIDTTWIESAVAATLILTGLALVIGQRMIPFKLDCILAIVFGLIHGLAFSEVFREMLLQGKQLALALLSFNVGIETIQLIILVLCYPIMARFVRSRSFIKLANLTGLLIILAGLAWFLDRTFDIPFTASDAIPNNIYQLLGGYSTLLILIALYPSLSRKCLGRYKE
jgi:hydrogenase/urease accessory protein HupE